MEFFSFCKKISENIFKKIFHTNWLILFLCAIVFYLYSTKNIRC